MANDRKLTPNFWLHEFANLTLMLPAQVEENIERMAILAQDMRDYFGRPMKITSCYRPASKTSHGFGLAIDAGISGIEPVEVAIVYAKWPEDEDPKDWYHKHTWPKRKYAGVNFGFGLYDKHFHRDIWIPGRNRYVPKENRRRWTGFSS